MAKKQSAQSFRFYDNRQKYLAFVHTCNEKAVVAGRVGQELDLVRPTPPALYFFDAGMGDGTVLSRLMRHAHAVHPTVPMVAVAKEISLEDVRLGLEKMPDRFTEHPATVLVITNLNYSDAPRLLLRDTQMAAALNWQEIRLTGHSSHSYEEQIEEISNSLADAWATHPSEKTGNPVYRRPSVLVVYREDHKFLLDSVIPRPGRPPPHYDLILASQPWRARMSAEFKASRVLAPLARSLAPGGRLLAIQSAGRADQITIGSIDGSCTGVADVKSGKIGATVMQFPAKMAEQGVQAVVKFAQDGTKPSGFNDTGSELITDKPVPGLESKDTAWGEQNCWG